MDYLKLPAYGEYMVHFGFWKGSQKANHKYTSRKLVNGKWQYTYDTPKKETNLNQNRRMSAREAQSLNNLASARKLYNKIENKVTNSNIVQNASKAISKTGNNLKQWSDSKKLTNKSNNNSIVKASPYQYMQYGAAKISEFMNNAKPQHLFPSAGSLKLKIEQGKKAIKNKIDRDITGKAYKDAAEKYQKLSDSNKRVYDRYKPKKTGDVKKDMAAQARYRDEHETLRDRINRNQKIADVYNRYYRENSLYGRAETAYNSVKGAAKEAQKTVKNAFNGKRNRKKKTSYKPRISWNPLGYWQRK